MTRVGFITHGQLQILLIDMSRQSPSGIMATIEEAQAIIARQPPASLLTLTDVTDAQHNREVTFRLKDYVAHNKPFVRAGAVVGLNELRRVLFNFLNRVTGRTLRGFDTLDDAKDWLARQ